MFSSRFMPCQECGASVDQGAPEGHECVPDRRVEYQLFQLRDEIERLESDIDRYRASALGRFDAYLASRQVRGLD